MYMNNKVSSQPLVSVWSGPLIVLHKRFKHFSYFSIEIYIVGTRRKQLSDLLLVCTHNIALLRHFSPKVLIFFLFLHKNICCGYS